MAAKIHLCLLLIILGTIAVQGARPGKPHFFRRQPGCKWSLLGLYILRTYALIVTAHPYCALNSCYNVTPRQYIWGGDRKKCNGFRKTRCSKKDQ